MQYVEIFLDGKVRKLRYGFNSVADIEARAEASIGTLFKKKRVGFDTMRLLVWGGLKWEDTELTIDDVGNMLERELEKCGSLDHISEMVNNALEKSKIFGKPDSKNAKPEAANPTSE